MLASPPPVSIIVVNLNGRHLLPDCLDSLAALDYESSRLEVIVVDNGSTDGSAQFLAERYPQVRVLQQERNLGFARGNNVGAHAASGEYLALLNNDARVDSGWLKALLSAIDPETGAVCAAAKILDWDGRTLDFAGGALNLYGRAFQLRQGWPVTQAGGDEPCELLFPCGGSMLIRRDVFLDVGGFDPRFVAYFEDVDLGWRLWLMGYRVVFAPAAITYHRQQATGARLFPVEQRYALAEANALRMVIKNYEDEQLWRILPLSLMLGVKRSLCQAGLDRSAYRLQPLTDPHADPQAGRTEPEPSMTRVSTAFLTAIEQVADEMPGLWEQRLKIQSRRKRTDREILERFAPRPDNPLFPWRAYQVTQDHLAQTFGLPPYLQPRYGSKLLIITHEIIGPRMAGPGIRAWEMARALGDEFDVTLAAPGSPALADPRVRVMAYEPDDPSYLALDPLIASADAVLAMGALWSRIPRLHDLNKPAIVDLYDPHELEKLAQIDTVPPEFWPEVELSSATDLQVELQAGDLYVCASERQRDLWLGALLATGRVNHLTYRADPTLRSLIDVVGFGLPESPPTADRPVLKGVVPGIGPADRVLLWNGGLWPWLDPLIVLAALQRVIPAHPNVRLYFAAGRHFDPSIVPDAGLYDKVQARVAELELGAHVFFGDWIPYDERGAYLLEADLAVCASPATVESRFASRTRVLDCIWAGLPMVLTSGDPLAELVQAQNLGIVVEPGKVDDLAAALLDLLAAPELRAQSAGRFQQAAAALTWKRQVAPLARFLRQPRLATDARQAGEALQRGLALRNQLMQRVAATQDQLTLLEQTIRQQQATIEQQSQAIARLEEHLAQVEAGKVMRLMNALKKVRR